MLEQYKIAHKEGPTTRLKNGLKKTAEVLVGPLGRDAYRESQKNGDSRLKSTLNGLWQAALPLSYTMYQENKGNNGYSKRDLQKLTVAYTSADILFNTMIALAPGADLPARILAKYAYGQFQVNWSKLAKRIDGID